MARCVRVNAASPLTRQEDALLLNRQSCSSDADAAGALITTETIKSLEVRYGCICASDDMMDVYV